MASIILDGHFSSLEVSSHEFGNSHVQVASKAWHVPGCWSQTGTPREGLVGFCMVLWLKDLNLNIPILSAPIHFLPFSGFSIGSVCFEGHEFPTAQPNPGRQATNWPAAQSATNATWAGPVWCRTFAQFVNVFCILVAKLLTLWYSNPPNR